MGRFYQFECLEKHSSAKEMKLVFKDKSEYKLQATNKQDLDYRNTNEGNSSSLVGLN